MKKRAVVFQSGGSTAVINQSLAGVIEEVRRSGKFSKLLGARFGVAGILNCDFVDLTGIMNSRSRARHTSPLLLSTPSSALGTCRLKLDSAGVGRILMNLKQEKIDTLFIIGGNDSADTGLRLSRTIQTIGIPKTIDNDLPGMDHAPGYGSVARFMAIATQEAALDTRAARTSDPIKIIETMGRNSGWIAAAASLGKRSEKDGPHLIYFPERQFDENQFLKDARRIYQKYGWALIVISETIRDKTGRRIGNAKKVVARDKFGHPYVEGAAQYLCSLLESKLKVRARFDKPGTIQRMSMEYISVTDQKEAYQCGVQGVALALQGKTGVIVSMKRISNRPYKISYGFVPMEIIANREKKLPDSFINREGNFVTKAFRDYALPLIGGALPEYQFWV